MSRKLELNFDDWLERYDIKQENNVYQSSFKKLNEKIEANKLLLKNKQKKIC
jgi:hypothetical protein